MELYARPDLRDVVRVPIQASANEGGMLRGPGKFAYPPFVVTEYGAAATSSHGLCSCVSSGKAHVAPLAVRHGLGCSLPHERASAIVQALLQSRPCMHDGRVLVALTLREGPGRSCSPCAHVSCGIVVVHTSRPATTVGSAAGPLLLRTACA